VQCLESYDVVLTTYEVIRQESQALATAEETRKKIHCPLFAVYWTLIILEEAHKISNQNNTFARAAYRLMGDYRLALTGTPIQNEYTDCQSLMRFLGIEPWSDVRHFKNVGFFF
jgi:SNF2 family DNA or RNA helicase